MSGKVTVVNAVLEEWEGTIVLRGVIEPDSLPHIERPRYQREILTRGRQQTSLQDALRDGERFPDVELGMRGSRTREPEPGVFVLLDPVYMIDGLQRITAAKKSMDGDDPVKDPHLGAMIHFNTTEEWERRRFTILNLDRSKVSPNIILRNLQEELPVMKNLYNLTSESFFVLRRRVQWQQQPKKGELITATSFVKTVGRLHAHLGPGLGSEVRSVAQGLEVIFQEIGAHRFRRNVVAFFDLLEECWTISDIEYRTAAAVPLLSNFLDQLARVLSDHPDFWSDEQDLQVPAAVVRKLQGIKVRDPHVANLAGGSGSAAGMLYDFFQKRINANKQVPYPIRSKSRTRLTTEEEED